MPPEDPTLPERRFSIVGKNALCVNIRTRSGWSGARWLEFAQTYFGPSTSIVGIKDQTGGGERAPTTTPLPPGRSDGAAGAASLTDDPSTCPRCDGEGCNHCGGMGRIVDDEP